MEIDLATIVPLIGALGFGSVIGQWFGGAKDRRAARAGVLEKLGTAEILRWPKTEDEADVDKLGEAIHELETAALLARLPRPVVRAYGQLATAAAWYIREDIAMYGYNPEEGAGGLNMDFSDAVLEAADIVSWTAWASPVTRRLRLGTRMRRLDEMIKAIGNKTAQVKIESARRLVR